MSFATACTEPAPQKQVDNDVGRSRLGQKAANQAGITDPRGPRYQDMALIDRFRPEADIGVSPIAAASRMLTHITIDSLAVQLSFHFVRHSQALGNTTR